MTDLQSQKKALRQQLLLERRSMNELEYAQSCGTISNTLLTLPEIQQARCVHLFWPILKNKEFDTRELINELRQQGKQCVLPRIISYTNTSEGGHRMEHSPYTGETNLRANRWDVYEPVSTETVPIASFDLVIVPALAVDLLGIRLGYGKGYYDELLTEVACPTICPVFNAFLKDRLPSESHDIPVDIVVTEETVIRR
ncbi:MAG: 5-formyltetrahydrofolate cyclo-ligase [Rhodothermaceae bacterium]|nr:5-formyltetrahydrofolate cyclo-ligase [Rhodothermaceae bacterium]